MAGYAGRLDLQDYYGPKDHINIRLLQNMVSGILLQRDLGTRM